MASRDGLDAIGGILEPDRAADFDGDSPSVRLGRARSKRVWMAEHRGTTLAPTSGVYVGGAYAICDGHHRVFVRKRAAR